MSRLVMKMKKQLYFPLLITLAASLIFGVLPLGQLSRVYAAPGLITNSPTGDTGGWTNPTNAYADGTGYASITSGTPSANQTYSGYGFSLAGYNIDQVRVRYDAWCVEQLITYVGAGAGVVNRSTDLTPALPAGFQANDLLLCFASVVGTGTQGTPSGWTALFQVAHATGVNKIALFYKIAAGGDAAPTVTYTPGGTQDTVIAQCAAFRGVDTTTPFDVQGTTSSNASQQPIGPISGITPTVNNALVIVFGHKAAEWTSVDTLLAGDGLTWSEIGEYSTITGTDAGQVWDYAIISGSPITITDKTFTVTGGVVETGMGLMVSIRPDPYEQIRVDVTWDGGTSWSSQNVTALSGAEATYWYDVTSATTWTPEKLNNTNFKVRVDAYAQGVASEVRLDWIPVEVTYSIPLPPDITNTPSNWDLGTVVADSTYDTGLSYFTITNNSAYPVTISIHGDNMTGGVTWFLSDNGEPGENIYALKAGLADTSYNITVPQSFANILVSPLAGEGGTQQWGLKFWTPTAPLPDYETSKSANVTLTAAQS